MANAGPDLATQMKDRLLEEARLLEAAGASLLDFTNSGPGRRCRPSRRPIAIPVIGGLGGGPWLDGRVRMGFAAIGYLAAALDDDVERYANVAQILAGRVRGASPTTCAAGRQIRGAAKPPDRELRTQRGDCGHRRHHDALRGRWATARRC